MMSNKLKKAEEKQVYEEIYGKKMPSQFAQWLPIVGIVLIIVGFAYNTIWPDSEPEIVQQILVTSNKNDEQLTSNIRLLDLTAEIGYDGFGYSTEVQLEDGRIANLKGIDDDVLVGVYEHKIWVSRYESNSTQDLSNQVAICSDAPHIATVDVEFISPDWVSNDPELISQIRTVLESNVYQQVRESDLGRAIFQERFEAWANTEGVTAHLFWMDSVECPISPEKRPTATPPWDWQNE